MNLREKSVNRPKLEEIGRLPEVGTDVSLSSDVWKIIRLSEVGRWILLPRIGESLDCPKKKKSVARNSRELIDCQKLTEQSIAEESGVSRLSEAGISLSSKIGESFDCSKMGKKSICCLKLGEVAGYPKLKKR